MAVTRRSFFCLPAAAILARTQGEEPRVETPSDGVPTFRSTVSLIRVDAKVTTRDGKDIGSLQSGDFLVYDEGERQTAAHFNRDSDPIEVLLLLDVSASMWPSLRQMTEKSAEALRELRPGDRVGVMVFSTRSEIAQPFTEDLSVIPSKIIGVIYQDRLGRTAFANEALMDAARYVASQKPGVRRVIVLVTDNDIFRNAVSDEQVIRALNANNLLLSTILVGAAEEKTTARYRDPAQTPPDVRRLARATGGDVVAGQNPGNALRHVLQDAVTKYTLQYPAPSAESGKYRRIRVELSPEARLKYPGAVVEARPGYETGN